MLSTVSAAEIQLLDGQLLVGPAITIYEDRLTLNQQDIALTDVDWLVVSAESPEDDRRYAAGGQGVLLQDGSWLPAIDIRTGDQADHLQVLSPFGFYTIPLLQVAGWGKVSNEEQLAAASTDSVMLMNGNTLAGAIEGVSAAGLRFRLANDPEPLVIPVAKVQWVRLALPAQELSDLHFQVWSDPGLPPLRLLPGDPLQIAALNEPFQPPSDSPIPRIYVSGGRRVPLADITPTSVVEYGYFSDSSSAQHVARWPYVRNQSFDGSAITIAGVRQRHGVVMHSYSALTWTLTEPYAFFRARIAVDDVVGSRGDCVVRCLVNDQERWSQRVRGGQSPHEVVLDLEASDTTFTIEVQFGERYDIGDHVVLGEAEFIRR